MYLFQSPWFVSRETGEKVRVVLTKNPCEGSVAQVSLEAIVPDKPMYLAGTKVVTFGTPAEMALAYAEAVHTGLQVLVDLQESFDTTLEFNCEGNYGTCVEPACISGFANHTTTDSHADSGGNGAAGDSGGPVPLDACTEAGVLLGPVS